MKKYIALAALPLLVVSCSTTPSKLKLSDISERPSQDAAQFSEAKLNEGMSYPTRVVDQSATSSLDVTEDSAGLASGFGTRQVRNFTNIGMRSTSRGSHIVRKEANRYAETVYDVGDQGTQILRDESVAYTGLVNNGTERVLHAGGTAVCGVMTAYSNTMESTTRGIFGGLLRCVVRDTKPYMVGSLNDTVVDNTMPGAGWRKRLPDLSSYAPAPAAATSGKAVYTSAK